MLHLDDCSRHLLDAVRLLQPALIDLVHKRLDGGYGYIFPGEFLRQSGFAAPRRTAYLQSSLTF